MEDCSHINQMMQVLCFGQTKASALAEGICLECKKLALPHCHSEQGTKDYHIHGVCEECCAELFAVLMETGGIDGDGPREIQAAASFHG